MTSADQTAYSTAQASAIHTAGPGTPAGAQTPGVAREALRLDESKSSLVEYLVADVRETITLAEQANAMLADDAARAEGAGQLGALGEALDRSARFFEFEQMRRLAETLVRVGAAGPGMDAGRVDQVVPRVAGVLELLREQADALAFATVIKRPIDGLCAAIAECIEAGRAPAGRTLPPGADATAALAADGVITAAPPPAPAPAVVDEPPAEGAIETSASHDEPVAQITPLPFAAVETTPVEPAVQGTTNIEIAPTSTPAGPAFALPPAPGADARLDGLRSLVAELGAQNARVVTLLGAARAQGFGDPKFHADLHAAAGELDRVTAGLRSAVARARTRPLNDLFALFRTADDAACTWEGGDAEVNADVLASLAAPVGAIVRALATPGGAPTLALRGLVESGRLHLSITSAGADLAQLDSAAVIANDALAALGGFADVENRHGRAGVRASVPVTTAVVPSVLVRAAGGVFALPSGNVVEVVRAPGGAGMPVLSAGQCLAGMAAPGAEPLVVVLSVGGERFGLAVAEIAGRQDAVVEPIGHALPQASAVGGATARDDGGAALVVNPERLLRFAGLHTAGRRGAVNPGPSSGQPPFELAA